MTGSVCSCSDNDVFSQGGTVGANGRLITDVYLLEVKAPADITTDWDYFNVLATIPGSEAFIDPAESGCALVAAN